MADSFNLLQMYQDDDDDDLMEDTIPTTTDLLVSDDVEETESAPMHRDESLECHDRKIEDLNLNDSLQDTSVGGSLLASVDVLQDAVKDPVYEIQDGVEVADEDRKDADPLDMFLPPPPKEKCSDDLQERINKFLAYKRQGKSFNVEVRNRKDYRNPDFLRHAVRYQDIDDIGSCFKKDVFDPHGYDKSDFYDALEAAITRDRERKEQERKKSQKVEFVTGATQGGTIGIAPKVMVPSSGVSNMPTGASQSSSGDLLIRESRHKKSKWDKVDGDRKNLFSGGHENITAVGARAALLSATNAGAGYAMFAQQNRRETEDKRTSEKRLDRKS